MAETQQDKDNPQSSRAAQAGQQTTGSTSKAAQQAATPQQGPERGEGRSGGMQAYRSPEMVRGGGGSLSPFSMMRRFMDDMDRMFEGFVGGGIPDVFGRESAPFFRGTWTPSVDVFERNGQLVVHADLPGMKAEDVQVKVEQGLLTLSGERRHEHTHEKEGVYQCERSYGRFRRTIAIDEGVDPESIRASFDKGVLEVTMPLPKRREGRTIPIGSKSPNVTH
jgi:HSP20 family protein